MDMISKARAKLKLTMMSKGKIESLSIKEIPKVWRDFGTKGDRWINVEFPETENTTGCIYVGKKDSVFDPHIHEHTVEHLTVLNPGGEMEVITDEYIKTVTYPDSIVIPMGMPHAVIFTKETKILVLWHPSFEDGWSANFLKKQS